MTTHGWIRAFSPGCVGDYCDDKKGINAALAKCEYCAECQAIILRAISQGTINVRQVAAIYKILDFAADRKTCFVLMPFDKRFDPVYAKAIEPTLRKWKWAYTRADRRFQPREIMTLITNRS